MILAVRGFDVADSVCLYNAELKIPAFTKGKSNWVYLYYSRIISCYYYHGSYRFAFVFTFCHVSSLLIITSLCTVSVLIVYLFLVFIVYCYFVSRVASRSNQVEFVYVFYSILQILSSCYFPIICPHPVYILLIY